MKTMLLITSMLLGLAGGMAQDKTQPAAPKPAATPAASKVPAIETPAKEAYPVIGHLEKRDRIITIKSSPGGAVYSVATKDGQVLLENISAEQLKAQAPELHDLIKTGVANDARAGKRAISDASLSPLR